MAFIRAYALHQGDPFRLRLPRFIRPPKKLRKLAGKAFGIAKLAAPFVPGLNVASLAGRVGKIGSLIRAGGKARRGIQLYRDLVNQAAASSPAVALPEDDDVTQEMGFARSYGYDWEGDPAPRRKSAASGPRSKAAKKSDKRAQRSAGAPQRTGPEKRRPRGGAKGPSMGEMVLRNATEAGKKVGGALFRNRGKVIDLGREILGGNYGGIDPRMLEQLERGGIQLGGRGGKVGGKRLNPTNVKALRRALRRVDGFAKLADKVQKDARSILKHVHREPRAARSGGRGHRSGCGCVVCRRKG